MAVVAQVPVSDFVVTIVPDQTRKFSICNPEDIASTQVFHATELSFALVNLKPVVPGHCLVAPRRVEARFGALSADEVADLWATAQRVGTAVERHYGAEALTVRAPARASP